MSFTPHLKYRCLVAEKDAQGNVTAAIAERTLGEPVQGEVVVRIAYSSLNYKDALAATGHPGVARRLPLVPGIDAAGSIAVSKSDRFQVGDEVLVFHAQFGTERDGGYAEYAIVPEDWVFKLPRGLSLLEAMSIGTGGFTAAQCIDELLRHQITPDRGEVVVSGSTGGVGIYAVKLLARLGYQVVAATGKAHLVDWLKQHGAKEVITRADLDDHSNRPLLSARWAGAVDTVGGNTLASILRATRPYGCVTACGLVGGADLPLTVYPFILRGVTLQGVDTAGITTAYRAELWQRLANDWRLNDLEKLSYVVPLDGLTEEIARILRGEIAGRVVVKL
jgi:putative YhdH/YhfP family quinone oxidoreductase